MSRYYIIPGRIQLDMSERYEDIIDSPFTSNFLNISPRKGGPYKYVKRINYYNRIFLMRNYIHYRIYRTHTF